MKKLVFLLFCVSFFTLSAQAQGIRNDPNLVSITFFEKTALTPIPYIFGSQSVELITQRPDPLSAANRDFQSGANEYHDVFYSNADGTFNIDGEYVTVEVRYNNIGSSGNIAEVQLNFADSTSRYASCVASFEAYGATAVPGSVGRAADEDLGTWPSLGNTMATTERIRLTLSFDTTDTDGDGIENGCDPDDDNDGVLDEDDTFPLDPTESVDTDGDGTGNNADLDDDGDGQLDAHEIACGSDSLDASSTSTDADGDSIPDCVDPDDDGDNIPDTCDVDSHPSAPDYDGDGIIDGSSCDTVIGPPTNKDQCKNGGWQFWTRANGTTFRNQGDCIQYVNTGM